MCRLKNNLETPPYYQQSYRASPIWMVLYSTQLTLSFETLSLTTKFRNHKAKIKIQIKLDKSKIEHEN